ncbi:hypothetical protein GGX14DRAFT_404829 [Mycena pura]|uniref:Uncharacterized protein n=1 Tax=Mycena pura TaxID=153505 RepID=A0AAD6UTC5_9AGAR|nr:hypothetical protein GGX14DRAFT_404829 [Mycena pura]
MLHNNDTDIQRAVELQLASLCSQHCKTAVWKNNLSTPQVNAGHCPVHEQQSSSSAEWVNIPVELESGWGSILGIDFLSKGVHVCNLLRWYVGWRCTQGPAKLILHSSVSTTPNKYERQQLTDELVEVIALTRLLESLGDTEDSDDQDDALDNELAPTPISELLLMGLVSIHSHRYPNDWRNISKSTETLQLLLNVWKLQPEFFRSYLCITPATFDVLLIAIEDDVVFQNNSELAEQFPVPWQLGM